VKSQLLLQTKDKNSTTSECCHRSANTNSK